MERIFQQTYHIPGTLAANITPQAARCRATAPCCTSARLPATTATPRSRSARAPMTMPTWSDVPSATRVHRWRRVGPTSWAGSTPASSDGTILVITLDFDGAAAPPPKT